MRGLLNFLMRVAFLALGVALAAKIVRGISYSDGETLLLVAVLLGLFNAFLKPVLVLFTLPFVVLSLGLGLWVINALILYLTGTLLAPEFQVTGFGSALLGALIVSLTNMALAKLIGPASGRRPPSVPAPRPPPDGRGDVIDV